LERRKVLMVAREALRARVTDWGWLRGGGESSPMLKKV